MERVNVFIVTMPTFNGVVEKIKNAIDDAFEVPKTKKKPFFCFDDEDEDEDFTPKNLRVKKPCGKTQPWGVRGKKADENLRFGAEFAIDEPMCEQYDCRWEFEDDHEAYDRFVTAGEDCVARGLARPEGVISHRCNAIRKPIGCPPPMRDELPSELIGETHWWDEDFKW